MDESGRHPSGAYHRRTGATSRMDETEASGLWRVLPSQAANRGPFSRATVL